MGFVALEVALELVRALKPLVKKIAQYDRDLADQIQRAGSSAPMCLAEGRKRTGRDRLHLFKVADGSASEVKTALLIAEAWEYVTAAELVEAMRILDRLGGLCWGLRR